MIKTYCDICNEPISEDDIHSGFAVPSEHGNRFQHFFHTQAAKDILKDKEYTAAIEKFVEQVSGGDEAKAIAEKVAKETKLDFETFEIAIRAFYSFAKYTIEKEKT